VAQQQVLDGANKSRMKHHRSRNRQAR